MDPITALPTKTYTNVQTGTDASGKAIYSSGIAGPGQSAPTSTAPTTIPNNLQQSPFGVNATTPSPISVSGLTANASPITTPTYNSPQPPSIQDIYAQYGNTQGVTDATNAENTTLSSIKSLTESLGQKSAENTRLMGEAGIPGLQSQLNDINTLIHNYTAQAGQAKLGSEDRLAPEFAINGEQASIDRQLSMKTLGLSAAADAINGQLGLANDKVTRALAAEFDPITAELDYYKQALTVNQSNLSTAQQKEATQIQAALADRTNQVQQQQSLRTQMYTIITQNGANIPADVINKALSSDPQAGLTLLSQYTTQSGRYQATTDAYGNPMVFDTRTGTLGSGGGGALGDHTTTTSSGAVVNQLPFAQYGLLSKTNFNPNDLTDQLAQKYLSQYLNGTQPTATSLGRSIKPGALAQVDQRARDLYFKATGQSLPSDTNITKGYQEQLIGNNKLLNNLAVQENTIQANSQLLLQNLNGNNINQSAPLINGIIDNIRNALGDPNVASYIAQNTTVSNELGALLALKNAQGTTVHDKLEAAGLISKSASAGQIASVVQKLMQEAVNAHSAIQSASSELYKQVDPLMLDANNPLRTQMQNQPLVEAAFTKQGGSYDHFISATPAGEIPVLDKTSQTIGYIPANEFNESHYLKI